MDGRPQISTTIAGIVRRLHDSLEHLALRAFYWLRIEGEAQTLSPALGRRIAECLNALLESLSTQDFAPTARFLAQERKRTAGEKVEAQVQQTVALLDACERAIGEGLQGDQNSNHALVATRTALQTLTHQARRHWLHLCLEKVGETRSLEAIGKLTTLSRALNAAQDLDELVRTLFQGLQEIIPHEDAQLLIWGRRQEEPLVRSARSHLFAGHGRAVDGYSNWVAFQRTPLLVPNLEAGPRPKHAARPAYQSYLGIPLLQGERLVSTLALVSTQPNAFSQSDLDLLLALEAVLCAALQRVAPESGPLDDLHRRLEEQNIILTFGREMSAALEEGRIFSLLLFKAMELTDSDAGVVVTVDPLRQECTIQALSGYAGDVTAEDTLIASPTMSWNVGIVGRVARTGQAALVPNVAESADYLAVRKETHSQLAIPIHLHGETIGVIGLESNSLNAYTEEHLKTVEILADHAAVAIGTTRLYNQVRESREWLAGLVANLPEGVIVTDEDLRVILSNPASAHFFRLEPPLPEGVDLEAYLLGSLSPFLKDPQTLRNFFQRTRHLDQGLTESWIDLKEPGQRLWVVSCPLWSEGGRSGGRVILIRDARQQRDGEREQLSFISIISHELRTPLTSVLGYADLLRSRNFSREEQKEFLDTILEQAEHLSSMVNDLLDLSRLDRKRMQMNWTICSFYQVVASLSGQLDSLMTERHKLLLDVDENLPPLYMDRDKVRAILTNLIGNAVKYSPDGGEIVLKAELLTDPAQVPEVNLPTPDLAILVSVQDQGIGIPEEALPHIFDRFYRVDNSVTRQIGGIGLGLTIAKTLVELHGGTIWVRSRPGIGSTFYFTLPIRDRRPREEE